MMVYWIVGIVAVMVIYSFVAAKAEKQGNSRGEESAQGWVTLGWIVLGIIGLFALSRC